MSADSRGGGGSVQTEEQAVLEKLLEDHVGHHNAITENRLADALGLNKSTLRSEIERLRDQRQIPIQNFRDGNGYFLPTDEEEFRAQIGKWNKRKKTLTRRIEHHIEAWERWDSDDETASDDADEPEVTEATYPCARCGTETPKSDIRHGDSGEYEDEPLCKGCYLYHPIEA